MAGMKILFLSDNFPPEVNAPASRTYEHAKRWVEAGASVTVITCAPNFPRGIVHSGYENRWRSTETVDGIKVVRVKTFISGNEGFATRIFDYLSFMVSAVFFGLFEPRPSVVVGTSPQFFAACGAWLLSILKWRPFVFELRDLWPASIVTVGAMRSGIAIRLLEALELFLYRRAQLIVSVTESFVDDLEYRGIPREKMVVVRNGVDRERFKPCEKSSATAERYDVADRFVVSYLGTHGMAHALGNVLDAASLLKDELGVVFLLVGDGAEKAVIQRRVESENLENVVLHDSVPKAEMPALWSVTNAALVHLKDDPVFSTVIPSKIFEAFGMGKPIIIAQPDGEAAEIVRSAGAGEWIAPEDPAALAAIVKRWAQDSDLVSSYAGNAAAAANDHDRSRLADILLQHLNRCA